MSPQRSGAAVLKGLTTGRESKQVGEVPQSEDEVV